MVTRPTNPLFTGREDLLQEMDGIVRDAVETPKSQTQRRIVISGMGGRGRAKAASTSHIAFDTYGCLDSLVAQAPWSRLTLGTWCFGPEISARGYPNSETPFGARR